MRKVFVGIVGGTVLLLGVILIFTPGPAILVIPVGLGILATEFAWARVYKEKFEDKWAQLRGKKASSRPPADPAP